jgi:hypothetical protein
MVLRAKSRALWLMLFAAFGGDTASLGSAADSGPLSPWSKLTSDGESLVMTEKSLLLAPNGLPRQIALGKEALLLAPVRLTVAGNVVTERDVVRRPAWAISASGDHANYDAEASILVDGERVRMAVNGEVWFDGLITIELSTAQMPDVLRGKAISYRISLSKDLGRFMHRWGPVGKRNVDLNALGDQLTFPYLPYLWLGNDFRGLFWLSESPAGWQNAKNSNAMRLVREGGNVALEVTILAERLPDGSWRHRFGLMATPVKTLPKDWRSMRMVPAIGASAYVMWPNDKEIGAPHFGYPSSLRPDAFARDIESYKRGGVTALPYACPTWVATQAPEWLQHQSEWAGGVADRTFSGGEWGGQFVNVCPARGSWKEFVRTRFGAFIQQFGLTGLYMDNAQVYEIHGCLEHDNHRDYLEYPMLDQRDSYRSVMESLRKNSSKTFGLVHSSGGMNLPSFSFVDAWVSGEQYRDLVRDDYLDVASLIDFRVELNGVHWGLVPFFLPEFPPDQARAVAPTRKLMSILLLHDVTPWPLWANVDEINRDLAMLDQFNVKDAEFVPYYSSRPLAKASAPSVFVSGYRKKDRSLLITANLTKDAISTQLCPDPEVVGAATAVYAWPERKPLRLANGCVPIDIPPGSFAMYYAARDPARLN